MSQNIEIPGTIVQVEFANTRAAGQMFRNSRLCAAWLVHSPGLSCGFGASKWTVYPSDVNSKGKCCWTLFKYQQRSRFPGRCWVEVGHPTPDEVFRELGKKIQLLLWVVSRFYRNGTRVRCQINLQYLHDCRRAVAKRDAEYFLMFQKTFSRFSPCSLGIPASCAFRYMSRTDAVTFSCSSASMVSRKFGSGGGIPLYLLKYIHMRSLVTSVGLMFVSSRIRPIWEIMKQCILALFPFVDGFPIAEQSAQSRVKRFCSSSVFLSTWRRCKAGIPINKSSHANLSSENLNDLFNKSSGPADKIKVTLLMAHVWLKLNELLSSPVFRSTWIYICFMADIISMPRRYAFSVTFFETILWTLPSSQLPMAEV